MDDLESKLKEKEEELSSTVNKAKEAVALADANLSELISATDENKRLSVDLKQCKADLDEGRELCREYSAQVRKHQERINDLENELKKVNDNLKEQNNKNDELLTQVDSLNTQCTSYSNRISMLNTEKDKAFGKMELSESLLAKTEVTLGDKVKSLEEKLYEQRQQSIDNSSQIVVLKTSLQEAQQRVITLEKDNTTKDNENRALERSMMTVTSDCNKANETITSLEGRLALATQNVKDMVENNSRFISYYTRYNFRYYTSYVFFGFKFCYFVSA